MTRRGTRRRPAPVAGEVDVDIAERYLMNHRGWCNVPDGLACLGCRQTCIEGVAALRATGRLVIPPGITSFVGLPGVRDVWHFNMPEDHPDVQLVLRALTSPQCEGFDDALEAAKVIVASLIHTGLFREEPMILDKSEEAS